MKQELFEKIVEYRFPNGDKLDGNYFYYLVGNFVMFFIWIIISPITFFTEEQHITKKVYFRRMK